jgi:hypothetical protein
MTRSARLLLAILGLLTIEASAQAPQESPAASKSILWSRTWDGALREAKIRNVPIYILVSIGEG